MSSVEIPFLGKSQWWVETGVELWPQRESKSCFRNSISKPNKKLTFVLKFKLKGQKWPWKIQRPTLSCFSRFCKDQNVHLSLSLHFSLHHHSTPAPPWLHLLSQPNLDSRYRLSTVPTRLTFFSSENAQNRLSLVVSNHRRPKFSPLPTPDVARRFSSLVLNLFSEFFYLHMCFILFCFDFINWHIYSYVERKFILFDKML